MNKEESKGKNYRFFLFMNYTNYKEVYLNKDREGDSNGERIIRKTTRE